MRKSKVFALRNCGGPLQTRQKAPRPTQGSVGRGNERKAEDECDECDEYKGNASCYEDGFMRSQSLTRTLETGNAARMMHTMYSTCVKESCTVDQPV